MIFEDALDLMRKGHKMVVDNDPKHYYFIPKLAILDEDDEYRALSDDELSDYLIAKVSMYDGTIKLIPEGLSSLRYSSSWISKPLWTDVSIDDSCSIIVAIPKTALISNVSYYLGSSDNTKSIFMYKNDSNGKTRKYKLDPNRMSLSLVDSDYNYSFYESNDDGWFDVDPKVISNYEEL